MNNETNYNIANASDELKRIKKLYGEEMMHLCRELFSSILDTRGMLLRILTKNIAPTRSLAKDIIKNGLQEDFQTLIYGIYKKEIKPKERIETNKSPFELMQEAGYTLYECHSEEDIQKFKHFYAPDEELCTFMGGRLNKAIVFFAVKNNVDEIKRSEIPKRQDEYGTSVISIQISKGQNHIVSIKNRYNHTIKDQNPDATFSNDLDNIIDGLTDSFEKYCHLKISQTHLTDNEEFLLELHYIRLTDGKIYKVNAASKEAIFCADNIIYTENGGVIDQYAKNKEIYVLVDQYMFDLKTKTVFDPISGKKDSFIQSILDVGEIESMRLAKNGNNRVINIGYKDGKKVSIEIDENNSIIKYENNYVTVIGNDFLADNTNVESVVLSKVEKVGERFLANAGHIKEIMLPELRKVEKLFMAYAWELKKVFLPKAEKIEAMFLFACEKVEEVFLPEVREISYSFMDSDRNLSNISLPKVEIIGNNFLPNNENIRKISFPEVREIGVCFLQQNRNLCDDDLYLPKLENGWPMLYGGAVRRRPRT